MAPVRDIHIRFRNFVGTFTGLMQGPIFKAITGGMLFQTIHSGLNTIFVPKLEKIPKMTLRHIELLVKTLVLW